MLELLQHGWVELASVESLTGVHARVLLEHVHRAWNGVVYLVRCGTVRPLSLRLTTSIAVGQELREWEAAAEGVDVVGGCGCCQLSQWTSAAVVALTGCSHGAVHDGAQNLAKA